VTTHHAAAVDVVIVGAGMAGLTAARSLTDSGLAVMVLDKGRAVGGRMATRRIGDARFDHGAQHFSARSSSFRSSVAGWIAAGVAAGWFRSRSVTDPERGVETRHRGTDGMRGIPEHLAEGLDVRTAVHVGALLMRDGAAVAIAGRTEVRARAAVVTAPLPQLIDLVDLSGDVRLADSIAAVEYAPCLAVMARLDGPSGLVDGHAAIDGGAVAWVADNQHKGISSVPAITVHSTPEFARRHLDDPDDTWVPALVESAQPHLDATVVAATGHRWSYAQPRTTIDTGCAIVEGAAPLVLAGEVFAGARVEGAFLSGRAAADAVRDRLPA
jgi:predicted NAD/FAD-dependent oxidoreductase